VGREHPAPHAKGCTLLYETSLAAITTRALALAGQVYRHAEYSGLVDVALRVTPLRGVYSAGYQGERYEMGPAYGTDHYQRHTRPFASVLSDAPIELARELLSDLFEATAGRGYDAFSPT
jgi:hypothetical protein